MALAAHAAVIAGAFAAVLALAPRVAWAEDDDGRFATPPHRGRPAPVAVDDPYEREEPPRAAGPELVRAPVRLAVGPAAMTTGKGLGVGALGALDLGRGSVGARLSAVWTRGEAGTGSLARDSFGQYAAEIVLDLKKRGPWHPLLGVGFGVLHASSPTGSGFAGVGLMRVGAEYALGFEETDVRLGLSATAGLVGPSDDALRELRGVGLFVAHVAIGP